MITLSTAAKHPLDSATLLAIGAQQNLELSSVEKFLDQKQKLGLMDDKRLEVAINLAAIASVGLANGKLNTNQAMQVLGLALNASNEIGQNFWNDLNLEKRVAACFRIQRAFTEIVANNDGTLLPAQITHAAQEITKDLKLVKV